MFFLAFLIASGISDMVDKVNSGKSKLNLLVKLVNKSCFFFSKTPYKFPPIHRFFQLPPLLLLNYK